MIHSLRDGEKKNVFLNDEHWRDFQEMGLIDIVHAVDEKGNGSWIAGERHCIHLFAKVKPYVYWEVRDESGDGRSVHFDYVVKIRISWRRLLSTVWQKRLFIVDKTDTASKEKTGDFLPNASLQ